MGYAKNVAIGVAAALALAGCASTQRLLSYGNNNAQAQIEVQGRRMNVWSHPTDQTLLISQTVGDATRGGAVEGATLGLAGGFKPDPRAIDAAVTAFLAPVGCTPSPVVEIGHTSIQFEAAYTCRDAVNVRELMFAQKDALMAGQPLHRTVMR